MCIRVYVTYFCILTLIHTLIHILFVYIHIIYIQGHLGNVVRFGPSIFIHTSIQLIVHFSVIVGLGKVFKLPFKEIALGMYI